MDIITYILNISERDVLTCSTHTKNGVLIIELTLRNKQKDCSFCGKKEIVTKEYKLRKITHAPLNKKKCIIYYKARRYKCKFCKKTFYENNSFVESKKKISKIISINAL